MLTGLCEDKAIVLMLNDADLLVDGMGILSDEHFTDRINKQVFSIIKRQYDEGKPVTPLTIAEPCRTIQGFSLAKIMSATFASKSEFGYVCEQLEDIRQGQAAYHVLKSACDNLREESTGKVVDSVMENLYRIVDKKSIDEIVTGEDLASRAIAHIQARRTNDNRGIYTAWGKLNRMIGAFEPGDLVIVSAPTGKGKSAFCQNIFYHLSVRAKIPGLYVNSEMSEEQMSLRWAAMLSGIDHSRLRSKEKLTEDENDKILDGMNKMYQSKFACITIPDLSIDRVSSIVRRYKKTNNVQAVAVDYIGRMDTMNAKLREDQVLLNAAKRLKTLAQQTQVVMFMVAQVRKDGQLQSASYMENEADLHLRLEPMPEGEAEEMIKKMLPWNYRVYISKGRNCPQGWAFMQFKGETLTFLGEA